MISSRPHVVCRIMTRSHGLIKLPDILNNHFTYKCIEENIAMLQVEPIEEIMAEASSTQATDAWETRALIKHTHAERSALPGIKNTAS